MNPCIFSKFGQHPFRYDVCRSCTSYTQGCNNYLGEYKYSKPIQTRQTKPYNETHGQFEDTLRDVEVKGKTAEVYSRVVLLQNIRSISEPLLPRPNFMERFRKQDRGAI